MTPIKGSGRALKIKRIERNVASIDLALDFYCHGLGFDLVDPPGVLSADRTTLLGTAHASVARARLGQEIVDFVSFSDARADISPASRACDSSFQHMALVTEDIDACFARLDPLPYQRLSRQGPVILPINSGGVTAFKFRDAEGHPLEFLQFLKPMGVIAADAIASAGRASVDDHASHCGLHAIDHTAIAVSDLTASLAFYCDTLGFVMKGKSLNEGKEQADLDNLDNVVLNVVSLALPGAPRPHLELLAYQDPRPARTDKDRKPDALLSDRIVLEVDALEAIILRLETVPGCVLHHRTDDSLLMQDPDGHYVILTTGGD